MGGTTGARIPSEVDAFVGRAEDLARLDEAFASGERVVTLVGPGGMGKTRLAVHWASAHAHRFSSVVFADVASARDVGTFAARLALALDVPSGGDDLERIERLGEQLAGHGDVLFVVDNVEQVIEDAAASIARLHELAPRAFLLVTSREALDVRGEVRLELGPIAVPDDRASPEAMRASEALQLLLDRARDEGALASDETELRLAAELVRRLDGIPLAIELAAARVSTLGVGATLERIARSIDALGTGPRDGVLRQRTMRSTIEWSLALLGDEERDAFALAGVFLGPFAPEAVEAVFVDDAALDRIVALVDKSLLRSFRPPGLSGERRFGFYEPLHQVARERFVAHPAAEKMRRRHAQYFVAHGEALAALVDRGGQRDVAARLALAQDDLVGATETLLDSGSTALAARAVLALSPILAVQGLYDRSSALHARVLAKLPAEKELLRADVLARAAAVAHVLGQRDSATAQLAQAVVLSRDNGDRAREGRYERELARVLAGRPDEAATHIDRAIALLREVGDARDLGRALSTKGVRAYETGDRHEAETLFRESIRLLHEAGDARWEGIARCQLAIVLEDEARWDEAERMLFQATRCADVDGAWNVAVMVDQARAALAHARGDLDLAEALYEAVAATHQRVNDRVFFAIYIGYRGVVARERGDLARASSLLGESCDALGAVGERYHRALFRAHLAGVAAALGRLDEASRGLDEAEAWSEGEPLAPVRRIVALERRALATEEPSGGPGPDDPTDEVGTREPPIDERITRRILATARRPVDAVKSERDAARSRLRLVVEREGRFVEALGAARVSLATRLVARRLLVALVTARLEHPGEPVHRDDLVRAGWPDERIYPEAAKNRLHVGISTLRKLGLADVLLRGSDGYFLDPHVALEVVG